MSSETNKVDPVEALLAATFGPGIVADLPVTQEVEKPVVYSPSGRDRQTVVKGPNGMTYREVEAPALKLDGTPRKRTQRIAVTTGFGAEARREASEAEVLKALVYGAESLADLQAATGFAKLTCKRALARLEMAGRVLSAKAPPSGRRGRPAFLYRPTVVIDPRSDAESLNGSEPVQEASSRQNPVSGDDSGVVAPGIEQ